jgi:hypothetical protein
MCVEEWVSPKKRKCLAAEGVLVVFAVASPTPLTAQGFLGRSVDEPRDEPQPREDVDHREELAERGDRGEIPQSYGRQRGDTEVERVHNAPLLDHTVEQSPAQERKGDEERQGAKLGVHPPSSDNSEKQTTQGEEEVDHATQA